MASKRVVYVSSTFVDLEGHRAALKAALERARYDVECMEKYPAFDQRPQDKCLDDVAACDFYVLLIAHRYGFVPPANNPQAKSITQLEYEHAVANGKRPLVFVVNDDHPWPPKLIDKGKAGSRLAALCGHVQLEHGVTAFTTPDNLATQVLQALSARAQEAAVAAPRPVAYRWPAAWDFSAYMAHKGKDFVGRDWLFRDIDAWLVQPAPRALLIRADFGVGKSAIMAELIRRNPAGAIVGWHFCQHDTQDTLNPVAFVRSLAAQFATALPGYRTLVESEAALQERLDRAGEDPASTFEAAIVAPLARIDPPNGARLLVIDALDEALEFDAAAGQRHGSIIRLLANKAGRLPDWLRLLVTSRNNPDVITPLSTFGLKEIDAENVANQADLRDYALLRCMREPLATRLCEANRSAENIADLLRDKSLGKFLYTIRALDDLENGNISPDDLAGLPPGMDSFYLDAFERRFARAGRNYDEARELLGVLALAKEPLPLATLAEILGQPETALQAVRRLLPDFIRLRGKLWAFDHFSLAEWLTGVGDDGFARAGDYAVDVAATAERFHAWASEKVSQGKAHESAYLVRHLAAHLGDANERRDVFRKLMLTSYDWLAERLRLADADALIADCVQLGDAPEGSVMRALFRSSAHVLRRYPDQLPAQLLGRIRSLGGPANPLAELLAATQAWLDRRQTDPNRPILLPTTGSLRISASQIARFEGHTDSVTTLVALADGRVASGSVDGTVRIWDPEGVREPRVLKGHTRGVTSLMALADGRLASVSRDGTVRLWDPEGVREPRVLEGHTGGVKSLVALADGRLASGSVDGTVRIWDPEGVREPRVLKGHTRGVTSLMALADGRLASVSRDGTVRLWDPEEVREPRVLEGHTGGVTSLVALADGRLASGSTDGTVRLWDPAGVREPRVLEGHTDRVTSLVALADGRLASGSDDGTVRLWDPEGMGEPRVLEGHTSSVTSLVALADGRLASGSDDRTVHLWDPDGLREPRVLEGHTGWVTSLVALADGRLASGSFDCTVRLWDPEGVREPRVLEGRTGWVTSFVALADGRLASASGDGTVRLWDPEGVREPRVLEGHTDSVTSLVALADGRLASASGDGTVRLWDPEGMGEPRVLEGRTGWVTSFVALADGRLASASGDGTVRLWDPEGVRESRVLEGHTDSVTSLVALADGRLASASGDGTVRLWDPEGGRESRVLEGHTDSVTSLVALADGRLASGSHDGTVRLWDPEGVREPRVLEGHTREVTSLVALADGRLASASHDGTVRLWDPEGGREPRVLEGHTDSVTSLVALADGRLASASDDGTVRLWDTRFGRQIALFVADAAIWALAAAGADTLAAGDATGAVHFLRLHS